MPYMSDEVQEIGINTLSNYRGRGYATIACQGSINEILKNGKIPQWSTSITNIASQKLAEKLGFVKLGDVITLTI
jgi:predicted GNAT family acetyltransferase